MVLRFKKELQIVNEKIVSKSDTQTITVRALNVSKTLRPETPGMDDFVIAMVSILF